MSEERYSTRTDCILHEIVVPIEAGGAAKAIEYDMDAIADELVVMDTDGINPVYHMDADEETFWTTVEAHVLRWYSYGKVDGVGTLSVWWDRRPCERHVDEFKAFGEREVSNRFADCIIALAQRVDESPEFGDTGLLSIYRYRIEPVTTDIAAQIIGTSDAYVRQLIADGKLPAKRVSERRWILDRDDVEEYAVTPHPTGPRKATVR